MHLLAFSVKQSARVYIHSHGMLFSEITTYYDFTSKTIIGDLRYEKFNMLKYGKEQCQMDAQVDQCRHEALFQVIFLWSVQYFFNLTFWPHLS